MYHAFYQLHTDPFRLTPDPAFCFAHERYARALAYMRYALHQGEGFIMVTGLPGTGKTTLLEQFHAELKGGRTLVAKLASTQVQAEELLHLICLSLGVSLKAANKASMLHGLREFFIQQANKGRRILLLIDEAQDLPVPALEELRLLGNVQLNARPLLQVFLVGQQQLLDMVQLPAMRPLYQRLVAACHLQPLNLEETRAYIQYRLERAGWSGGPAFDERSYRMIHHVTDGLPRQINKVCSRLLLYGSMEAKSSLDCFDCIKVLKHWLEELPGSTSADSFQACIDMLNASWGDAQGRHTVDEAVEAAVQGVAREALLSAQGQGTAQLAAEPEAQSVESGESIAAPVRAECNAGEGGEALNETPDAAVPIAEQQEPCADDTQAPAQVVAEPPETEEEPKVLMTAQAVSAHDGGSPVPVAGEPEAAVGDTHRAVAEGSPAGGTARDAAIDPQPAVPVRHVPLATTRSRTAMRRSRFSINPELRRRLAKRRPRFIINPELLNKFVKHRPRFTINPELLHKLAKHRPRFAINAELLRNFSMRRASAPLGVLAALLAGLLLLSGEHQDGGTGDPAAALDGPQVAGGALVLAELASRMPPESTADGGMPERMTHDATRDEHAIGPAVKQSEADAADEATGPVESPNQAAAAGAGNPESQGQSLQGGDQVELGDGDEGINTESETEPDAEVVALAAVALTAGTPSAEPQVDEQADTPKPVEAPAAVQAGREQPSIDALMIRAERAFWEDRLTIPRGNNAFDYYRQVLERAPQHRGARAGMQRIARRYARLIERALANDKTRNARAYVARGLRVSPGNSELLALRDEISAREFGLETQAALAAAEANAAPVESPQPEQQAGQEEQPRRLLDRLKAFFSKPVPAETP